MKTKRPGIVVACAWLVVSAPAFAQRPAEGFYVGAGLSSNDAGGDSATGFQFFGGFDLSKAGLDPAPFGLAVEAGYMNSGDFEVSTPFGTVTTEAKGLWATGVATYPVNPQFDLLGRLGLDFGDDDGLMFGVGAAFDIDEQMQLRGEFVARDTIDSLQINLLFRL